MSKLNEKVSQVEEKIRVYVSENLNSRITYFFGKTKTGVKSIIILNEEPFSEGGYQSYAFVSTDIDVYRILKTHFSGNMTKLKRYKLNELINN